MILDFELPDLSLPPAPRRSHTLHITDVAERKDWEAIERWAREVQNRFRALEVWAKEVHTALESL